MREGNLVIDSKTLSALMGLPVSEVEKRLEAIKNCQMLTIVHDGKLIVLMPDADSTAVHESNEMYERFIQHAGRRGL